MLSILLSREFLIAGNSLSVDWLDPSFACQILKPSKRRLESAKAGHAPSSGPGEVKLYLALAPRPARFFELSLCPW